MEPFCYVCGKPFDKFAAHIVGLGDARFRHSECIAASAEFVKRLAIEASGSQPVDPKDVTEGWWLVQTQDDKGKDEKIIVYAFRTVREPDKLLIHFSDGLEPLAWGASEAKWLKKLDLDQLARMP